MLRNRVYYRFKPLVPARVRLALRRWVVKQKYQKVQNIWPIDPSAAQKPKGWPGWPEGKKFAFVLTHDVEGVAGMQTSRNLMELEMKEGFRSSFNFIPEGEYAVPPDLRAELIRNGFEVGVHDLRHDGKLYWSKQEFLQNAERINHYLKEWKVEGFRSGFMLRDLDWLGELNVNYDASTFDTDPFEPMPDGAKTIYPFWVKNSNGKRYVELPYTLPQDSTLFLFLQEKTIDIWKRKLSWVAENGGMAMVIVHPDYIAFDEKHKSARGQYSPELYQEFLRWVKEKFSGQYWHALPSEVANYFRKCQPPEN